MRRSAISRLVLVATIASIAAGLAGTTVVVARDPVAGGTRPARATDDPGRQRSYLRESRLVSVADLPEPDRSRPTFDPPLLHPETGSGAKAPSDVQAALPPAFATTTGPSTVTKPVAFEGLADSASATEPPDPWVAVGPEHVIQAVNTTIRISNRSGVMQEEFDTIDFFDLQGLSPMSPFDPRVIYDSLHGRWIAVATHFDCTIDPLLGNQAGFGYIDVAVSQSADPTGTWDVLGLFWPDEIPDYPGIGTSTDKVVLSANLFWLEPTVDPLPEDPTCFIGDFAESELDVFSFAQLIDPTSGLDWDSFYGGAHYLNNYSTWRPAVQAPATSATAFVVGEGPGLNVTYTTITGNPASGTTVLTAFKDLSATDALAPFAVPPAPKQPGSPATIADAVDERPTDAVWQNNQMAFVSTYPCNPPGGVSENRDCVRVSELSTTTATPTKLQDFLIGEEGADHYMGGVGYAGNGDLHVVWTRSSEVAGNYPSSYAAHQRVTDAANALSAPQLLKQGTGTYPGTRWGDYVGVAQDPQVPNAVWQANQYSAGASGWGTHVSQLQTGGSSYVPITPLRIVDSRIPTGVAGVFTSSVPRPFAVAGVGTIPANAIAVTGNVTVVGQQAAGYVSITPTATATPPNSTINFPLGDIRANNFTASLNASGDLAAVYKASTGKKTHIIVDITGYFVAGSGEATYTTITTKRVMDTRPGSHIGTATTFRHGIPQTISIPDDIDIPSTATAITANLTIVGQTRAGYLSVTPEPPVGNPLTSTINFPLGDIRANGLTADLNAAGDLSMTYVAVAGATTNVLLDITGYYVEDDAGGLLFYPLNPGRVLDSRPGIVLTGLSGAFISSQARTLDVDGHWGVPALAKAITGNITVVGQTAAGYVSVTPVATNTPLTSTINFPLGDIRANGITVPLASGGTGLVYKAGTSKTTHLLLDVTGYFK